MYLDLDDDNVTSETMCWRLGLKHLYNSGKITDAEFEFMYSPEILFGYDLNDRENLIAHMVTETISDIDMVTKLISDEFRLDQIGYDRNITVCEWKLYIRECLNDGLVNQGEYSDLSGLFVNGDTEITRLERLVARNVIEKLHLRSLQKEPTIIKYIDDCGKVSALKQVPDLIQYIDAPTFDMLMVANGMGVV